MAAPQALAGPPRDGVLVALNCADGTSGPECRHAAPERKPATPAPPRNSETQRPVPHQAPDRVPPNAAQVPPQRTIRPGQQQTPQQAPQQAQQPAQQDLHQAQKERQQEHQRRRQQEADARNQPGVPQRQIQQGSPLEAPTRLPPAGRSVDPMTAPPSTAQPRGNPPVGPSGPPAALPAEASGVPRGHPVPPVYPGGSPTSLPPAGARPPVAPGVTAGDLPYRGAPPQAGQPGGARPAAAGSLPVAPTFPPAQTIQGPSGGTPAAAAAAREAAKARWVFAARSPARDRPSGYRTFASGPTGHGGCGDHRGPTRSPGRFRYQPPGPRWLSHRDHADDPPGRQPEVYRLPADRRQPQRDDHACLRRWPPGDMGPRLSAALDRQRG
jgi:hypothetical protein